MTKPTPAFIATIIGLILVIGSLWIMATAYNAAMDRKAEDILRSSKGWQPRRLYCNGPVTWDCVMAYNTGEENGQAKQVRTD